MTEALETSMIQAMHDHRAALLAQCPPPAAPLSDDAAAALPIHVAREGTTGPTVLFVHGGVQGGSGGGATTFARQLPLAQQGWQLVMVERPGFGRSPSRGVDDMVADAGWIADLAGDGAHLIGHSWGGAAVLLAAARRPDAVRSLVLVEPAMQPLLMSDPATRGNAAVMADAARTGRILMEAESPGAYAIAFARSLRTASPAPNAPNAHAPNPVDALEADPERAMRSGCALLQARMAPPDVMRHAAVAVAVAGIPVLVVTGGWSPSFDGGGDLVARLTHGRHVIVPSPNHFPQLTNAEAFNAVVQAFLREARGPHRPPVDAAR